MFFSSQFLYVAREEDDLIIRLKLHSFQMPGLVPSKVDGNGVVTYGPWGGTGGTMFDDRMYTGIKRINLSRNMVGIVWIRVLYDRDGDAIWGSKHGGNGGYKNEKVLSQAGLSLIR